MAGLQVKELSAKLADAETKKAALETMLALRERQASEVRVFLCYFSISIWGWTNAIFSFTPEDGNSAG